MVLRGGPPRRVLRFWSGALILKHEMEGAQVDPLKAKREGENEEEKERERLALVKKSTTFVFPTGGGCN